jgi:hypothetical protein
MLLIDYENQGSKVNKSGSELAKLRLSLEIVEKEKAAQMAAIKHLQNELNAYSNTNFDELFAEVKGKIVNGKLVKTKADYIAVIAKSCQIEVKQEQMVGVTTLLTTEMPPLKKVLPSQDTQIRWAFISVVGATFAGFLIYAIIKRYSLENNHLVKVSQPPTLAGTPKRKKTKRKR